MSGPEWECFRDVAYFNMWCVRQKGQRTFGEGFHAPSQAEAQALVSLLANGRMVADEPHPPATIRPDKSSERNAPVEDAPQSINT